MNKLPFTICRSPIHFDTPAARATQCEQAFIKPAPFVLSALRSKVYRSMSGVAASTLKLALLFVALSLPCSAQAAKNILVFGDSLSAGYGIARDDSWVSLLQRELKKNHPQFEVVNASISGETASGGLRRIGTALQQHQPAIVIIELGANDGLRGTPIKETEKNLDKIIEQVQKMNARVLLLGIQLPPNYGPDYTNQFRAIYPKLVKRYNVALVPFMLEGIAPAQFQTDNLHPNAAAQPRILQNVLRKLTPLLNAN
jgi:acyl-CoA thioesterase I